jgi:hypothetical protein
MPSRKLSYVTFVRLELYLKTGAPLSGLVVQLNADRLEYLHQVWKADDHAGRLQQEVSIRSQAHMGRILL